MKQIFVVRITRPKGKRPLPKAAITAALWELQPEAAADKIEVREVRRKGRPRAQRKL